MWEVWLWATTIIIEMVHINCYLIFKTATCWFDNEMKQIKRCATWTARTPSDYGVVALKRIMDGLSEFSATWNFRQGTQCPHSQSQYYVQQFHKLFVLVSIVVHSTFWFYAKFEIDKTPLGLSMLKFMSRERKVKSIVKSHQVTSFNSLETLYDQNKSVVNK